MKDVSKFTLVPRRWYAAEFIGDEFGDEEFGGNAWSLSAIRVDAIKPGGGDERNFDLSFHHANFPDEVRDKVYTLQMIERGRRYLLARSVTHEPARLLFIHELSALWLQEHCGLVATGDIQVWLHQNT